MKTGLSDGERERLEKVAGHPRSLRKHAWRARIVLALGSGHGLMETIRRTGMSKPTVWRWRDRFLAEGVDGLLRDATRPPGKKPIEEDKVKAPVDLAMSPPPAHARHWTLKALAGEIGGMEATTVRNILRRHGLRPHQVKTFKVSRDPRFEISVRAVVGLSVNPPDHAVVLSVDEKPQIQALGSTRRSLPMTSDHAETRTHDYRRHGTTCLLAALDVATGKVVGRTVERHRSAEFLSFLDHVAERGAEGIDPGTPVHVILDNVSSHRSAEAHEWLKGHPDWTFHFTPTSASWRGSSRSLRVSGSRTRSSTRWTPVSRRSGATSSTTTPGTRARSVGAAARRISWSPGSGATGGSGKWNQMNKFKH